ncbi:MAG: CBS domain-containing protein [Chloroflexi bacterium]|nr:CBS domain-containing protein [Chloroflexota bacterium]
MFVGERMSHPVITVSPETSIHDALAMFKKEHIRRAPVIKDGKLVGIIAERDLLNASPSPVTSLSVWEMNYLISKVTVKQVMTKKVKTIDVATPIEEAARIMADLKIGGLPVLRSGKVVGMITETDLFKILLELMGARTKGIRVTAAIDDTPGTLAKVTKAVADAGGNFISFGQFAGDDPSTRTLTFKVAGVKKDDIKKALAKVVKKFWDIRQG